jgi:hypothetical protein
METAVAQHDFTVSHLLQHANFPVGSKCGGYLEQCALSIYLEVYFICLMESLLS